MFSPISITYVAYLLAEQEQASYLNLSPADQERGKKDTANDTIMVTGRSKIIEQDEEYDTDVDVENCPDLRFVTDPSYTNTIRCTSPSNPQKP